MVPESRWMTRSLVVSVSVVALLVVTLVAAAAVSPAEYSDTLEPGQDVTIQKHVGVGETAEKVDVYFLADTTGSMGGVLAQVRANAAVLLASISADITDVQFGAGDYRDFPFDSYAFKNGAGIGPDDGVGGVTDASDAIQAWGAAGGADGSEGQFYALDQIAKDPAIGWRPGAQKIVVWFGDAPAHDPVCGAISGLGYGIAESSLTDDLVSAEITVVAISTITGSFYPAGLNDDPTKSASNYASSCGTPGGSSGQANRIAAATGGVHLSSATASEIVDKILEGISEVTVDITGSTIGDCSPLTVSLNPSVFEDVVGPATVTFDETISVAGDAAPGEYHCQVLFTASGGRVGVQDIWITVPDQQTPPVASCVEAANPNGNNVPRAGQNSPGQNEDGFYALMGTDADGDAVELFVTSTGASGAVFGPFSAGDIVKVTQAADNKTPESKEMGSGAGNAGAVEAHLILDGDAVVFAVDAAGNVSDDALCLVPKPAK